MSVGQYRLGIDFGTSSTVAAIDGGASGVRMLLFDGRPTLASAVFAGPDATLYLGEAAERGAAAFPAGLEANPKRRVDDATVWLGVHAYRVVDVIAAVLRRVADEAVRVTGGVPGQVVLTHPANWGRVRLGVLAEAATTAGLGPVTFVAEPIAAAAYFATVLGRDLPPGQCLVVYDLGAGTCDVAVVRQNPGGLTVIAADGLDSVGGLDLDAAVVDHARRSGVAGAGDAWGRLDWPQTPHDQQVRRDLWRGAREAKEHLSRHTTAELHIPLVEADWHLTREEFDRAVIALLTRTVELTVAVLRRTSTPPEQVAGVFLVGGSARVPLASTLLHRTMRIEPTLIEEPELVVAAGSLAAIPPPSPAVAAPVPIPMAVPPPLPPVAGPAVARPRWSLGTAPTAAIIAIVVVMIVSVSLIVAQPWNARGGTPPGDATTDRAGASGSTGTAPPLSPRPLPTFDGPPYEHLAATLTNRAGFVEAIAFSPDGTRIMSAGGDYDGRLWDLATRQVIRQYTGHTRQVTAVAYSPNGKLVATASLDNTVRLWNVDSGQAATTLTGHTSGVVGVAFSPSGQFIATASLDNTARLWDVASGAELARLTVYPAGVSTVTFSPDGTTIAIDGNNKTALLWNVNTHKAGTVFTGHAEYITDVAFSPDGGTLATTSYDNTVRLWDVPTGKLKFTLTGHTGYTRAVAFSPDGKVLASTSDDHTIRLWDPRTGKSIATLTAHTAEVLAIAFSRDGRIMATASNDHTIRLWR